jgi:PAS domain S-box-containing protein
MHSRQLHHSHARKEPDPVNDAQAELVRVRAEFEDFRRYLPDALIEADLTTQTVTFMNRMALILFGYTEDDVAAGIPGAELFAPAGLKQALALIDRYVAKSRETDTPYERSGRQELFDQELRCKDGSTFWAETQTSFVLDDRGIPQRMRTIIRDITERRKGEQERQRTLIELQDALTSLRQLRSLLPICDTCRRIRNADGEWQEIGDYVRANAGISAAATVCRACSGESDGRRA